MTQEKSALQDMGIVGREGHLSFSQLSTYLSCGEKYRLSYVERVPREAQGPFLGGIAVHRAIEVSEREGFWTDPDAFRGPEAPAIDVFLTTLRASVAEAGGPDKVRWGGRKTRELPNGEDLPWWEKQGEFMLRRYRDTREAMVADGWAPVEGGVEMRVEANLPGVPRPVIGYLDKFLMHEGGEPLIVDYKSGRVGSVNPLQFATYARLLAVTRGLTVTRGVAVFLRAPDVARRVQPVKYADLVDRIDGVYGDLVRGIDAGIYAANPDGWHASCAVRESCWYWQATKDEP